MTLLSFDPGDRTGWAHSSGVTGTIDVRKMMARDRAEALWCIKQQAVDLMMRYRPDTVVIERPLGRPVATLWPETVNQIIHMAAWSLRIKRAEIAPNVWRKIVMGRANKVTDAEVMEAVMRRRFAPANEHEADAAALLIAEVMIAAQIKVAA